MIVCVVGLPGAGKTTWLKSQVKTRFKGYKVFESDSYRTNNFEEDMYTLLQDVTRDISPNKVVEGVQVFRLLRKGLQLGTFKPDEIIVLLTKTDDVRKERYKAREGRYPNAGFDKALLTIWKDYLKLWQQEKVKPIITEIYV